MQKQKMKVNKRENYILYLILVIFFFLLTEISVFFQCEKIYLYDFKFVSNQLAIPTSIYNEVFIFILTQIFLHIVLAFFILSIFILLDYFLTIKKKYRFTLFLTITLMILIDILISNQWLFPNSKFAFLNPFSEAITAYLYYGLNGIILSLCLISCLSFIDWAIEKKIIYFFISFVALLCTAISIIPMKAIIDGSSKEKPNIIIIGFDSLRPDFLGYFGNAYETPFMNELLESSAVFSEAITPLARTYPSWVSILTGMHPRVHGVRFNLSDVHPHSKHFLPFILKTSGYDTFFATDETRFSNLKNEFGFDKIITPPVGLGDFLIGTFNDFPLSNLLINTKIGKLLFPYSYANRPVYHTYDPNTFLSLIEDNLPSIRKKPIFLITHFCLTHNPYLWATLPANQYNVWERYAKSIERIDQQVRSYFKLLEKYQLLNHAIVILLSDHGEALEFFGDRITDKESFISTNKAKQPPKFYPPSVSDEFLNQSAGHGTDVLGLSQYHTLLTFKSFNTSFEIIPQLQVGVVSLMAIKPTILDLLKYPFDLQGSLVKVIAGKEKLKLIHHFIESDYSPAAIRTVFPETRKVLLEGVHLFQIDPETSRLFVKESMGKKIIKSKQIADIYGEWILAIYPKSKQKKFFILVNLMTGEWTDDLRSGFALNSPATLMLNELKNFYGEELKYL